MSYPPPITDSFRESLRYEYPLTPSSLVIDVGAHIGTFTLEISKRYGCYVEAYEPVGEFLSKWPTTLPPKVTIHGSGVGSFDGPAVFGLSGDSTGMLSFGDRCPVHLENITDVLGGRKVDLLKLNIEGAEYDLIDTMILRGHMAKINNLQVQFHRNVAKCEARHAELRVRLLKTHHLTYDFPFCWENYRINDA